MCIFSVYPDFCRIMQKKADAQELWKGKAPWNAAWCCRFAPAKFMQ
jgi:hypothetical protein